MTASEQMPLKFVMTIIMFRCMDSGSSNFKIDEEDPEGVLGRGLGRAKGVLIDAGLHSMYVHAIRRAKHFIYIENQFFTGVSLLIRLLPPYSITSSSTNSQHVLLQSLAHVLLHAA